MNFITYNPNKVAFNQTECAICLSDFAHGERVTQLACKHIFHGSCIETLDRCPKDQIFIGRSRNPRDREIQNLHQQFTNAHLSLDRLTRAAASYNLFMREDLETTQKLIQNNEWRAVAAFEPPEEIENHPNFAAVVKKADQLFLEEKAEERQQSNRFMRPFYAYPQSFGLEGSRFAQLCEMEEEAPPEVEEMRRDYQRMRATIQNIQKLSIGILIGAAGCATFNRYFG